MLGQLIALGNFPSAHGLAQVAGPLVPVVLLILCVLAGVGTVLALPGWREASWRKIGGVMLLTAGLIFAAVLIRWVAGSGQGGMGIYFWIFASLAIVASFRVITHTKPVYSALYFVLTVLSTAGLFLLLWAEFMAIALVLIYAGAILVTYVFVIMLAAEAASPRLRAGGGGASGALSGVAEHDAVSRDPIAAAAVGFTLMGLILFVVFDRAEGLSRAPATTPVPVAGAVQQLGAFLFRDHVVSLQVAGLILTVAMIGAIVIARKRVISEAPELTPISTAEAMVVAPATPIDDNPHSIPVYGTMNPRQKEFPET